MSNALWKRIQAFVGVITDGVPGDVTAAAVAAKLGIDTAAPVSVPSAGGFDPRSEGNIATLGPRTQAKAREWLAKCLVDGINVKIICGTRTFDEQADLYAQGRTRPGPRVTNSPPGYSWHNFGVAWDFVVFDEHGEPLWDSPLMERCGRIAESLGLQWGGSWTGFQDVPHIQMETGCTLAQARKRKNEGTWHLA